MRGVRYNQRRIRRYPRTRGRSRIYLVNQVFKKKFIILKTHFKKKKNLAGILTVTLMQQPSQKIKKIPTSVLEWIMGSGSTPTQESDKTIQNISLFYKITKIAPPPKENFNIYKGRLETYVIGANQDKLNSNYNMLVERYAVSKIELDEILRSCTNKNFQTFRKNKEKIDILAKQIRADGLKCISA